MEASLTTTSDVDDICNVAFLMRVSLHHHFTINSIYRKILSSVFHSLFMCLLCHASTIEDDFFLMNTSYTPKFVGYFRMFFVWVVIYRITMSISG